MLLVGYFMLMGIVRLVRWISAPADGASLVVVVPRAGAR
jgi:hypothetical protein